MSVDEWPHGRLYGIMGPELRSAPVTQHFTRSTVSAAFYCSKCAKVTQHRIDDRRKGPCLECIARLESQHAGAPKPEPERQGNLFS